MHYLQSHYYGYKLVASLTNRRDKNHLEGRLTQAAERGSINNLKQEWWWAHDTLMRRTGGNLRSSGVHVVEHFPLVIPADSTSLICSLDHCCNVKNETTDGWNTPKYSLNRWLLHKVHQWATILRFQPTIWFLQFDIISIKSQHWWNPRSNKHRKFGRDTKIQKHHKMSAL